MHTTELKAAIAKVLEHTEEWTYEDRGYDFVQCPECLWDNKSHREPGLHHNPGCEYEASLRLLESFVEQKEAPMHTEISHEQAQAELQQFIDSTLSNMSAHGATIKKKLRITRNVSYTQEFEFEVNLPESNLIQNILFHALREEMLDYGPHIEQHRDLVDDNFKTDK